MLVSSGVMLRCVFAQGPRTPAVLFTSPAPLLLSAVVAEMSSHDRSLEGGGAPWAGASSALAAWLQVAVVSVSHSASNVTSLCTVVPHM